MAQQNISAKKFIFCIFLSKLSKVTAGKGCLCMCGKKRGGRAGVLLNTRSQYLKHPTEIRRIVKHTEVVLQLFINCLYQLAQRLELNAMVKCPYHSSHGGIARCNETE